MIAQKILVVEDSTEFYELVCRSLNSDIELVQAKSLKAATETLDSLNFDLILLDIHLPDGDGYHFASVVRGIDRFRSIPIIFLTARTEAIDAVLAFSCGADDFIRKPFNSEEFNARIGAYLRKLKKRSDESDILIAGVLRVDLSQYTAKIIENGNSQIINLTPIEFKILVLLMKNEGIELDRDQILNEVWGETVYVNSRSVDTHVSKLRRHLGEYSYYVRSLHGKGYMLETRS